MNRFKKVKIASIIGILTNMFLFVIKISIGLFTKSQAMLADAFNSGGDVFSSGITYIGNKISSKPSDDDHNLGHGKAEYIYSLIISIIMIIVSFKVLQSSFLVLIYNKKYSFSIYLIVVCIVTIVAKYLLYIYTRKISIEENNILMEANSKDHLNDTLITSLNLISVILALNNIYYLDGIIGIVISIWIIISSIKIFKQSYDVLMDKSISIESKKEVLSVIKKHKEIKKINHFNSTPVGYKYQISFTIFVDGNLKTFESHEIADNLEKEIIKKFPEIYLVVIHVNPL
jgi:cation diffusion facilitator family transporter